MGSILCLNETTTRQADINSTPIIVLCLCMYSIMVSTRVPTIILLCHLLLLYTTSVCARDYTFTFLLQPGKTECFHDTITAGAMLELEYQVIEGGELDINFLLLDPNRNVMKSEQRQMDGLHSFDINLSGEYSICFGNDFSRVSHKMVYFDMIIESDEGEDDDGLAKDEDDSIVLDMKVQDIRKILHNLAQHLNKAELTQQFFRAREARHRYSLESSNSRVLTWSCINCVVMLGVGALQVYLIRSLFRSQRQDRIRT